LRQETFIEFIKKTRLPFFFTWPINLAYVCIVSLLIYQGTKENIGAAIVGPLFITVGFIGLKLFIYNSAYRIYSVGGRAIKELNEQPIEVFENVGLYIKGFDLLDQRKFFPPDIRKTIYDFDYADVILTKETLILMGKSNSFGGETYAYPVEITLGKQGLTSLPKAKLIDWQQIGKGIELQIEDSQYVNNIKIDIKDRAEEIKRWLTSGIFQAAEMRNLKGS